VNARHALFLVAAGIAAAAAAVVVNFFCGGHIPDNDASDNATRTKTSTTFFFK
jgi:hypothetical protein